MCECSTGSDEGSIYRVAKIALSFGSPMHLRLLTGRHPCGQARRGLRQISIVIGILSTSHSFWVSGGGKEGIVRCRVSFSMHISLGMSYCGASLEMSAVPGKGSPELKLDSQRKGRWKERER